MGVSYLQLLHARNLARQHERKHPFIASGLLLEHERPVPVVMDEQGILYKNDSPHTDAPQVAGKIFANGDFQLADHRYGNVFKNGNPLLHFNPEKLVIQGAIGQNLMDSQREQALRNSEIPLIRSRLTAQGIDGSGITIGVLEEGACGKNQGGYQPNSQGEHTLGVMSIINSPEVGVAPGSKVQGFRLEREPELVKRARRLEESARFFIHDDPIRFRERITHYEAEAFDRAAGKIEEILARRDATLRILNISTGGTRVKLYQQIAKVLEEQRDDKQGFRFPALRREVFRNPMGFSEMTDLEAWQAIVRYADALMDHCLSLKPAYDRYIDTTRKAKEAGVTVVVSAGNRHDAWATQPVPPRAEFNLLGMSPHVLVVAASDSNMTPGNVEDDALANFSSWGGEARPVFLGAGPDRFSPRVAAPGFNVLRAVSRSFPNGVGSGTSYAAPFVCGTIALMLQIKPSLTFEEIQEILTRTAVMPRVTMPKEAIGAGIVQPFEALNAVKGQR